MLLRHVLGYNCLFANKLAAVAPCPHSPLSQVFNSSGFVDFYLSKSKWAIELLRDGDRVNEHIGRFQEGGAYHNMVTAGLIKAYAVIDLRNPQAKQQQANRGNVPNLTTVNFDEGYKSAKIVSEGRTVHVRVGGGMQCGSGVSPMLRC